MDFRRTHKRISRAKIKKRMDGAISIFLCLILTPILTVTLSLIEYARYQQVIEISDEIMEISGLSLLNDYDEYLHKRFGVLAVSQEGGSSDEIQELLDTNSKLMGSMVTFSNAKAVGNSGFTLDDNDILKQQLMDVSELTGTGSVLLDDLKLQELINKLKGLTGIATFMNTIDKGADVAEKLNGVVESIQNLVNYINNIKNDLGTLTTKANTFVNDVSTLFDNLRTDGLTLAADASPDKISDAVTSFKDNYLPRLKTLYSDGQALKTLAEGIVNRIKAIGSMLESITTSFAEVKTALNSLKEATNSNGKSVADNPNQTMSAATQTLDSIVGDMDDVINESLTEIADNFIASMKDLAADMLDSIGETVGLKDFSTKLSSGYFEVDEDTGELSDAAKADIEDFLKKAGEVVLHSGAASAEDPAAAILEHLKSKNIIPSINSDVIDQLISRLNTSISQAVSNVGENVKTSLIDLLSKLINLAKEIISIDVFYDGRLDAVLESVNEDDDNAVVKAINQIIDAVNDFKDSIGSFNLIKAAKAVWDLAKSVKDLCAGLIKESTKLVNSIATTFSGSPTDIVRNLYSKFILSAYAVHNFPNRTDAGALNGDMTVVLNGTGLTGWKFDDIARGGANDTFKGAEMEYIFKGTKSEKVNQTLTFMDVFFLRLLVDLPSVFGGEVTAIAGAANIAAPVVYLIYILLEPFVDTVFLVNGTEVPLIRTSCWLTPSGIDNFVSKFTEIVTHCEDLEDSVKDGIKAKTDALFANVPSSGFTPEPGFFPCDYVTHVFLIMLLMENETDMLTRISFLMELEASAYYDAKGATFEMAKTYVTLDVSSDVEFTAFFNIGGAGSPFRLSGKMTRTLAY